MVRKCKVQIFWVGNKNLTHLSLLLSGVKLTVENVPNFVAISEYLNFKGKVTDHRKLNSLLASSKMFGRFRPGFSGKEILSILLSPEKLTHKKAEQFCKNFNSWMMKITVMQKNWYFAQFYHSRPGDFEVFLFHLYWGVIGSTDFFEAKFVS